MAAEHDFTRVRLRCTLRALHEEIALADILVDKVIPLLVEQGNLSLLVRIKGVIAAHLHFFIDRVPCCQVTLGPSLRAWRVGQCLACTSGLNLGFSLLCYLSDL